MKFINNAIFTTLLAAAIFQGCDNKDDDPAPQPTGLISGTVQVWNDKTAVLQDKSGVTVSITNITGKTTTTSADGSFRFEGLPFDSYDLEFSKSGYGTRKVFGFRHNSSSSSLPTVQFGAISSTTVTSFTIVSATYNGKPGVTYRYSTDPVPSSANKNYTRVFLGTSASVSSTGYAAFAPLRSSSNNDVEGGFTADELYALGFTSGQTVYLKIYGDSYQSNEYEDPATDKTVFPNLNGNSPAAVSFIVP
jgi:hypothetical protein